MNDAVPKILLIDDDRIVRESIAAYLDDSGFEVIEAEDGRVGFEIYKEDTPDLLICDLRMPKMDGLTLLREISNLKIDSPPPVIVISGAGAISDVVEALRMGASDYLVKPIVDMKVLEHSIRHCLERVSLQRENREYRLELEKTNKELKESLRVLEQDQRAGLQLQLKMFPQEQLSFGPYVVDHELIPSLYLSGDFVDYAPFEDNGIGFFIADVSGHGSSSAFVTALLHHLSVSMSRKFERRGGQPVSAAKILAYFNRELLAVGMEKYVTMFLGIINTDLGELNYSVAGHLPMPILASGDTAEYLEGSGMPLGIVSEVEYQDYTRKLPQNFTLSMFSDGVLEVLSEEGLLKKEDSLLNIIKDGNRSLAEIHEALKLDEIEVVPDDIAIMTVTRND